MYFADSPLPVWRFFAERGFAKGALGQGGSVAAFAFEAALWMGASEIWLAGLDLAFPGFATHYKGARFEEDAHAKSTRFRPAETASFHALRSGVPFWADSASGGRVLTDKRLSLYAAWFQARAARGDCPPVFRLGGDGIAIKGMAPASFSELLSRPRLPNGTEPLSASVTAQAPDVGMTEAKDELRGKLTSALKRRDGEKAAALLFPAGKMPEGLDALALDTAAALLARLDKQRAPGQTSS
jgi:hypothetical protein